MSVRTSFKQTGHKTAIVKFEEKPLGDQGTKPSFKVKTDPAIDTVKAIIGFLFGFAPLDAPPEPRLPAPQAPSHASRGIVFRFCGTAREDETAVVMQTLLAVFYFDGPFVFHFTERQQPTARPEPSPSRPTIEQSAPREKARAADSDLSWHHLSSRAGRGALGTPPLFMTAATVDARISQEPKEVESEELDDAPKAAVEPTPQIDLQEYANALAAQGPADETESRAAQPQVQHEHDPQVFAQYANALAELPASGPSGDEPPRAGAAS